MTQIDDCRTYTIENLEKSMTNFNVNTAIIMEQILELNRCQQESNANYTKQLELLIEEVKKLRFEGRMICDGMTKFM